MTETVEPAEAAPQAPAQVAPVTRRRVLYVPGYDPRGVAVYYRLYRSELRKHAEMHKLSAKTGRIEQPVPASPWIYRWTSNVAGPDGNVETVVDFLGWDDLIEHEARFGLHEIVWRSLRTFLISVFRGLYFRIGRLKRRSAILFAYPHVMSLLYILAMAAMIAGGWALAGWVAGLFSQTAWVRTAASVAGAAVGVFAAARFFRFVKRIDASTYVYHLILQVDFLRRNGLDRVTAMNERSAAMMAHVADTLRAAAPEEEVVVAGHSHGTYVAIGVVGRLLDAMPKLEGRRLILLNLGTALPATTFYGPTARFRRALRAILETPTLTWIEATATLDILGGTEGDYAAAYRLGLEPGTRRRPVLRKLDFRTVLKPETLAPMRWDFFRLHFQYLMASETGQGFDYFDLVCGPEPLAALADEGDGTPH